MAGSFVNVVVCRVPDGRSVVRPPSACPKCGARIRPHDNVPVVSWLVLRGHCRDCRSSISVRYPAVELFVAAVCAGVGWRFGATWTGAGEAVLLVGLISLGLIDLDHMVLPRRLVYATLSLVGVAYTSREHRPWQLGQDRYRSGLRRCSLGAVFRRQSRSPARARLRGRPPGARGRLRSRLAWCGGRRRRDRRGKRPWLASRGGACGSRQGDSAYRRPVRGVPCCGGGRGRARVSPQATPDLFAGTTKQAAGTTVNVVAALERLRWRSRAPRAAGRPCPGPLALARAKWRRGPRSCAGR